MYESFPLASKNSVVGKNAPACSALATLVSGSVNEGYVTGNSRRNVRALSALSNASSPMNATWRPNVTAARWKAGNSCRQGPHHDAHLLITTAKPRSPASRARNAAGFVASSAFACACSARSGAGEPAKAARTCAGLGAALRGVAPQPAAVSEAASASDAQIQLDRVIVGPEGSQMDRRADGRRSWARAWYCVTGKRGLSMRRVPRSFAVSNGVFTESRAASARVSILEVQSLQWAIPRQWPTRPRRFQVRLRYHAPKRSRASASGTR